MMTYPAERLPEVAAFFAPDDVGFSLCPRVHARCFIDTFGAFTRAIFPNFSVPKVPHARVVRSRKVQQNCDC
jgi:hypothetical protein